MNNRISGLDLGPDPDANAILNPTPIGTTPVLAPPRPVAPPVAGVDVVQKAKKEAEEEEDLVLKKFGLQLGSTWFANGTKMLGMGEQRAVALRKEWEAEETVGQACDRLIQVVRDERRVDYVVPLKTLKLEADGAVSGVNGNIVLNENAWGQLVARGPENLGKLRSNINLWAEHAGKKVGMFRTRKRNEETGAAECFAVMGQRYAKLDLDEVAAMAKEEMPRDAHATTFYDGGRWQIEVSFAAPFEIEAGDIGVGRLHRISAVFSGADNGTQSLRMKYKAIRIRCINCTLVATEKLVFEHRHVGQTLREFLKEAMQHSAEALEVFGMRWREANQRMIVDTIKGDELTPHEIFTRLVAHGYVSAAGAGGQKKTIELLMNAYEKEPGKTAAHINMAVSRMAHEQVSTWSSPWVMDDLETQAGQLLFNEIYALRPLSEEQEEKLAA